MGMEHVVTFAGGAGPSWPQVAAVLADAGFPAQTRMIDGQLAFPDEQPAADWRELRLGTAQGMVTLRREPDGLHVVTWGNADAALRQAWNAVAWAVARAGNGEIRGQTPEGFRRQTDMPQGMMGH